jgi:hypothetical protein
VKRLWKSITVFAIANMIALAAPAHAQIRTEADKTNVLRGMFAIGIYAAECMRETDPSRVRLMERIIDMASAFTDAERAAAGREIVNQIKQVGFDEFCRMTERAASRIR